MQKIILYPYAFGKEVKDNNSCDNPSGLYQNKHSGINVCFRLKVEKAGIKIPWKTFDI